MFESNKKLINYNIGIKHLFNSIKYVSDINNYLFDSNKYLFQSNKKFRSEIKFLRNICLVLVIHFFLTWNVRIEDLFNKFFTTILIRYFTYFSQVNILIIYCTIFLSQKKTYKIFDVTGNRTWVARILGGHAVRYAIARMLNRVIFSVIKCNSNYLII